MISLSASNSDLVELLFCTLDKYSLKHVLREDMNFTRGPWNYISAFQDLTVFSLFKWTTDPHPDSITKHFEEQPSPVGKNVTHERFWRILKVFAANLPG